MWVSTASIEFGNRMMIYLMCTLVGGITVLTGLRAETRHPCELIKELPWLESWLGGHGLPSRFRVACDVRTGP